MTRVDEDAVVDDVEAPVVEADDVEVDVDVLF
jgi:hypothetical protein